MNEIKRDEFFKHRTPLYRSDVNLYAKEVLLFTPDDWQKKVFDDITEHNRVTVRSGQGVGKTGLEAAVLLWFLTCFSFPRIVATAPTKQQLHDVLWSEVAKWQSRSPLLTEILKWTKTYIYMKGYEKRWFAVARTATKPENMQGFHEDNMLFIVDEASGVADPIMEAILGTLSGKNNKLLMCGNPTKLSGVFYDSHTKDRSSYRVHKVNAENSERTNKENIESLKRKYGAESNVVRVRVYGEFPEAEDDVFISLQLLENSVNTEITKGLIESIDIGCDVARFGDDKTVIGYKINEQVKFYKKIQGQNTMRTAADIALLGEKLIQKNKFNGYIPVKVDDGGVGGGVVDRLRQIKQSEPSRFEWMEVFPVQFGQPIKHRYFYDSTTAMMGTVKQLLNPYDEGGKPKPIELIIPNDDDLIGQLSSRKYTINERSKMVVESKKAMKARGLPSPDEADCLLLCCLPARTKKKGRKSIE